MERAHPVGNGAGPSRDLAATHEAQHHRDGLGDLEKRPNDFQVPGPLALPRWPMPR
jgi:hypothetical protein